MCNGVWGGGCCSRECLADRPPTFRKSKTRYHTSHGKHHKFPCLFQGKVPSQKWKNHSNALAQKSALMGTAGVTQKLIWRLIGQERREVPRSKLAPTRPGREYMRRRTPHRASSDLRYVFRTHSLIPGWMMSRKTFSFPTELSSNSFRHATNTSHMMCRDYTGRVAEHAVSRAKWS